MKYEIKLAVPDREEPAQLHEVTTYVVVKHGQDGLKAAQEAVKRYTPAVIQVEQVWEQQELDLEPDDVQVSEDQEMFELEAGVVTDVEFDPETGEVIDDAGDVEAGEVPAPEGEAGPEEEAGDE